MSKKSYSDRSKTAKCIKMLQILNNSGVVKIKDLALMLETNERNIPEYKETLTNAGYRVISTEDGFEAWTLIQTCETAEELSRKFECLITDIEMPAMDGITLSKQIKDSRVYRGLPIIVFSSFY